KRRRAKDRSSRSFSRAIAAGALRFRPPPSSEPCPPRTRHLTPHRRAKRLTAPGTPLPRARSLPRLRLPCRCACQDPPGGKTHRPSRVVGGSRRLGFQQARCALVRRTFETNLERPAIDGQRLFGAGVPRDGNQVALQFELRETPLIGRRQIASHKGQPRLRLRGQIESKVVKRRCQPRPDGFDERLLERPVTKKLATLLAGWSRAECCGFEL